MSKKTTSALILLLILGVVVLACTNKNNQAPADDKTATSTVSDIGTSATTTVPEQEVINIIEKKGTDKRGWNVYQSKQQKFEIKLPSTFEAKSLDQDAYFIKKTNANEPYLENGDMDISLIITDIKGGLDLEGWFKKNVKAENGYSPKLGNRTSEIKRVDFLNSKAIILTVKFDQPIEGYPGIFRTIYFQKNNNIFSITADVPFGNNKQQELFKEIISTFKFIQ